MKAVVAAFNQEKALVGAFSVITNLQLELFEALIHTTLHLYPRHHVPGTGNGIDGKCTSIEDVPECADYKSDNPDADRVE